MKKILALVLSLVLMLGCTTTAFAANDPYEGGCDMPVTAYSYGSFYLYIPENVDFTGSLGGECLLLSGDISDNNFCKNIVMKTIYQLWEFVVDRILL